MTEVNVNDTDKWPDLILGSLSPEEEEPLLSKLVPEAVEKLQDFLEIEPEADKRVAEILEKRLGTKMSTETWNIVHSALTQYLGYEVASLLYWVIKVLDPHENRLNEIKNYQVSPKAMAFFRAIVGLFGLDMSEAFEMWDRLPDAWKTVYRDVYYDYLNKTYRIRVTFEKYNGEQMTVEGDGSSILTLISHLMNTVNLLGVPDAFDETSIDLFSTHLSRFIKIVNPEEENSAPELPDSQEDT